MNYRFTLACLCMLLSTIAFSQRGQASVTSTEGWTITVNMEYRNMRITDAKKNCTNGFNYKLDIDYTYSFSDGVNRSMYWLGTNGDCFSDGGNMTVEQNIAQSGTVSSPTRWSDLKSPCHKVDYASFACLPQFVIFHGPGIPEQEVEIQPFSESPGNLPIELTNFRASRVENQVQLNWETASELTNDYFLVERSSDAVRWQSIGNLAGAGTSLETNYYHFSDAQPLSGTTYYRLTQVDTDGTSTVSGIVTVTGPETADVSPITLYPNPATDQLIVKADRAVSVYDLQGRQLEARVVKAGEGEFRVDLTGLPIGMYVVRAGNEVRRFIHQ